MAVEYKIIGGDGHEYGPASLEETREWCEQGRVDRKTLVWRSDEQRWVAARDRDELKWDLPPEAPPTRAPAPDSTVPPSQRVSTDDLFIISAGFWIRAAAFAVDWIVFTALISLVTLPWTGPDGPLTQLQRAAFAEARLEHPNMEILTRFWLISMAINLPLGFLYNTWFNGRRGATPGKQLLGLRVVREDGSALGYRRAALRYLAELVTFLSFGAGYLLVAFHPEKRALHDLIAGTRVIHSR